MNTPPNSPSEYTALVGATIYVSPTETPIRDAVVLIQGEKIVSVGSRAQMQFPETARVLDCFGLTITAGLWNSHVHFFERKWADVAAIPAPELSRQLQDMLARYGFTSVFDTGSVWENTRRLRDRIDSGEVPGPKIRSTGEGLVPPGALPSDQVLGMMGVMKLPAPEIADAAQAAAAAKKLLDAGVDGIKIFASAPRCAPLPENVFQAAVNEAHRAGKPVFVHPNNAADVLTAVRGGVDIVAHTTPHSGPWDEALLTTMKERRVALTPTLTLWKYYMRHDRLSAQEKVTDTEIGQLRAWVATGGTVLFGTDLGAVEYDPTAEYALMSEAGMTFPQILASLTTNPAERFGDANKLGRIAAGLHADLAVLHQDPAINLRALAHAKYTLRAGKIIYRAAE
ncbi:MAG TPA: amidohydrolase family protein [Candidatus Acidoferrum sp.]|nr:amidohydrolase family protein [Candidatus Acidoferrum sp.]